MGVGRTRPDAPFGLPPQVKSVKLTIGLLNNSFIVLLI